MVVENFGPGVMEKKNLSWPEVQANKSRRDHGVGLCLWARKYALS